MNSLSFINILLFLLLSHIAYGQAATILDEASYQKLENQFEADEVSPEQLFLFERKGIQNLKDFVSLMAIMSSKDVDQRFVDRFKTAAVKYFSTPKDSILFFKNNEKKIFLAEKFIQEQLKENSIFEDVELAILDSSTPELFEKSYKWTISFRLVQNENVPKRMIATLILKKGKKQFGNTEKEIWDVYFERIEELQ